MATFKIGILGGFKGKVGPVIGTSWKGKAVMRSRALSVHDPKTLLQQQQRERFSLIGKFVTNALGFINEGFRHQAVDMTESNVAMKVNVMEAITGTWPNFSIDYSKLTVAKGTLDLPYNPSASVNGNEIDVSWTDNSGEGNAKPDDSVMILVYNSSKGKAIYDLAVAERATGSATYNVPATWTGDSAVVFLAMNNREHNSDSVYLGTFTL